MIVLKFDTGIKGDCSVTGHENWVTCDGLRFGVGHTITTSGVGQIHDVLTRALGITARSCIQFKRGSHV